jgi:hypothetical protein
MYLRRCYRVKDGKRHAYWSLVEAVRTARGPRQRVVAYLGQMDKPTRMGLRHAAQNREGFQGALFDETQPQWVEIDASRMRVEGCRELGGSYLGLELMKRLGLMEFFADILPAGREDVPWSAMAAVLVLCRLLNPSSELAIAEHHYEQSALADLLGVPAAKVNDDRLYRTLDALLPHKDALQVHLKNRLGELFRLDYDLLLYDVTSTYFEGQAEGNPQARRGYSRDHRGDCKQVCIGLVVSRCGMPLGYKVFDGNRADVTTLQEIIATRIEQGLLDLQAACIRQKQNPILIAQRLGKLLGRNTRAAGLFKTEVQTACDGSAWLDWQKVQGWQQWASLSEGCYILRSNVTDWKPAELWKAYIQLTEAEGAFRIHKSDLSLRPIWHQKQDRVQAHILVCFLAYVLWKTLGQLCQRSGLGDEPRKVLAELSQIRVIDVILPTRSGVNLRKRCVTHPSEHQAILLHHLGLHLPSRMRLIDTPTEQM